MSRIKNGFSTNAKNTLVAAELTAEAAIDIKNKIFLGNINVTLVDTVRVCPDQLNPRTIEICKEEILSGFNFKNPNYASLKKEIKSEKKLGEINQLEKLANSIKQNGLLNAIVVYKDGNQLNIVTGERRYLSCLLLGYESIPAKILSKKPNNFQLRVIQWAENCDREDLTAWDRLDNVRVITESYKEENADSLSSRKLADIINVGKSQAAKYLQLLKEPINGNLMIAIKKNEITSLRVADFLSSIQDLSVKNTLIELARKGASLVDLQKQIQKLQEQNVKADTKPIAKISFQSPQKINTASFIIKNILSSAPLAEYQNEFSNINWNDILEINKAWGILIKILEDLQAGT